MQENQVASEPNPRSEENQQDRIASEIQGMDLPTWISSSSDFVSDLV